MNSIIINQIDHYGETGEIAIDNNLEEVVGLEIDFTGRLIETVVGLESEIPGMYCEIITERNQSYMVVDFSHGY